MLGYQADLFLGIAGRQVMLFHPFFLKRRLNARIAPLFGL
jgi:hypothetical protein